MINFYYEHAVLSPTHSIIVDSILLRLLRPLVTLGALVVGSVVSPLRLLLCHLGPLVARAKSAESSTESSAVSSAESLLRLLLCHLGPLVALTASAEPSASPGALEASVVPLLRLLRPLVTSGALEVASVVPLLRLHLGPLVAIAKSSEESSEESSAESSAVSLLRLLRPLTTSSSVVVSPSLSPASLRFL